jgi:hypothetical protein
VDDFFGVIEEAQADPALQRSAAFRIKADLAEKEIRSKLVEAAGEGPGPQSRFLRSFIEIHLPHRVALYDRTLGEMFRTSLDTQCANNLAQIGLLSELYRKNHGGPNYNLPEALGEAYFRELVAKGVEPKDTRTFACPHVDAPGGVVTYRGPAKNLNIAGNYNFKDGIVVCDNRAHADGANVLTKGYQIVALQRVSADYRRAIAGTLVPAPVAEQSLEALRREVEALKAELAQAKRALREAFEKLGPEDRERVRRSAPSLFRDPSKEPEAAELIARLEAACKQFERDTGAFPPGDAKPPFGTRRLVEAFRARPYLDVSTLPLNADGDIANPVDPTDIIHYRDNTSKPEGGPPVRNGHGVDLWTADAKGAEDGIRNAR